MLYFKDNLNGAVRKIDETNPRNKTKIKAFRKAQKYSLEDGKIVPDGSKWETTTEVEYNKFIGLKAPEKK